MPLTRNALACNAQFACQRKCWNSSVCINCKIANVSHYTGVIVKKCDISSARGERITEKESSRGLFTAYWRVDYQWGADMWRCVSLWMFCTFLSQRRERQRERQGVRVDVTKACKRYSPIITSALAWEQLTGIGHPCYDEPALLTSILMNLAK